MYMRFELVNGCRMLKVSANTEGRTIIDPVSISGSGNEKTPDNSVGVVLTFRTVVIDGLFSVRVAVKTSGESVIFHIVETAGEFRLATRPNKTGELLTF